MDVIQCESAEAAELIIARVGAELSLLVTDFRLAGEGTGLDVACFAKERFPHLRVILMSGENSLQIPADVRFLQKAVSPGRPARRLKPTADCGALVPCQFKRRLRLCPDRPGRGSFPKIAERASPLG